VSRSTLGFARFRSWPADPFENGAFCGYAERRFADSLRDMHAKARVPALAGCGAGQETFRRIETTRLQAGNGRNSPGSIIVADRTPKKH